jgi:hypothetical protein
MTRTRGGRCDDVEEEEQSAETIKELYVRTNRDGVANRRGPPVQESDSHIFYNRIG